MAADLEFKIEGLDGFLERLRTLPEKLQKSGARKATRKAANVIRNAARVRAKQFDDPATAETIWKKIVTQESGRRGKRLGGILMRVGVLGGARRGTPLRHWVHQEFGTEHMKAQPFMRPALENNVGQVTETLVRELNLELDRLIATQVTVK